MRRAFVNGEEVVAPKRLPARTETVQRSDDERGGFWEFEFVTGGRGWAYGDDMQVVAS